MVIMGAHLMIEPTLTALDLNTFQMKSKNSWEIKIVTNIYRIQAYISIMCGYFCIGFINFMLKGKSLLTYTNLFSPSEYEENDKMTLTYFQQLKRLR